MRYSLVSSISVQMVPSTLQSGSLDQLNDLSGLEARGMSFFTDVDDDDDAADEDILDLSKIFTFHFFFISNVLRLTKCFLV